MASTKIIKGIIGACLTPFDDNDQIDYPALEKEMDFLLADCDAVTIAAVEAAEYTMLTREERKELLKWARRWSISACRSLLAVPARRLAK
jgi:4-hydroxy-tetrahydrodipicolinate synthase